MQWHGLDEVSADFGPSAVAIGVFDGVHRGHQRLIATARAAAGRLGLTTVAVTFYPNPAAVVRPGSEPLTLTTLDARARLLIAAGADYVCVLPFTREFSQLEPDEFTRVVVAGRLRARWVVVGDNFRFGHRAAGDVSLLAELGEKYEFTAEPVPLLATHGVVISSSAVRDSLASGDVAAAAGLLGRPHRLEGVVVRGEQRGRQLGFPTANLATAPGLALPADGVYAGWLATVGGAGEDTERWPAAISVGLNTTFGGQRRTVEAYALDRDDLELYGAAAAVEFTARLRGMATFGSAEELIGQIRLDVDQARAILTP